MATNEKSLDAIARRQSYLSKRFKENNIFVSQRINNDKDEATVIVSLACDHSDQDECYLQIRRLLKALEYRLNKDSDFILTTNLTRKEPSK